MDRYGTERRITEILNRAYGDNATSALDRIAAGEILSELINLGWTSNEEIAYLVDAAGGEIRITEDSLNESAPRLLQYRDHLSNTIVFQTKTDEQRKNPTPAERESSEARVVQSGPIKATTTRSDDSTGENQEENDTIH